MNFLNFVQSILQSPPKYKSIFLSYNDSVLENEASKVSEDNLFIVKPFSRFPVGLLRRAHLMSAYTDSCPTGTASRYERERDTLSDYLILNTD